MELTLFLWHMPDDTTEGLAEHSSRLQPSINLHAPVTAALVPNVLARRDEGLGKPCIVIEASVYWPPLRIRTWAAGLKIISGDHYTTTALPLHTITGTYCNHIVIHKRLPHKAANFHTPPLVHICPISEHLHKKTSS